MVSATVILSPVESQLAKLGLPASQPESDSPAAVPRWRHKLVSHAEQVPQDIVCDAGQANQHGAVSEIVVSHVVNVGSGCQQFGAVIEADADHKRTWLSRTMRRHACQQFPANLERGCSVCRALLHAGQRQADLPYSIEVNCAPVFLRGFDLLRRSSIRF